MVYSPEVVRSRNSAARDDQTQTEDDVQANLLPSQNVKIVMSKRNAWQEAGVEIADDAESSRKRAEDVAINAFEWFVVAEIIGQPVRV